jgi:hypothetical protein
MTSFYIIFGGMMVFATVVGVYDWLAERHDRRESLRKRSA